MIVSVVQKGSVIQNVASHIAAETVPVSTCTVLTSNTVATSNAPCLKVISVHTEADRKDRNSPVITSRYFPSSNELPILQHPDTLKNSTVKSSVQTTVEGSRNDQVVIPRIASTQDETRVCVENTTRVPTRNFQSSTNTLSQEKNTSSRANIMSSALFSQAASMMSDMSYPGETSSVAGIPTADAGIPTFSDGHIDRTVPSQTFLCADQNAYFAQPVYDISSLQGQFHAPQYPSFPVTNVPPAKGSNFAVPQQVYKRAEFDPGGNSCAFSDAYVEVDNSNNNNATAHDLIVRFMHQFRENQRNLEKILEQQRRQLQQSRAQSILAESQRLCQKINMIEENDVKSSSHEVLNASQYVECKAEGSGNVKEIGSVKSAAVLFHPRGNLKHSEQVRTDSQEMRSTSPQLKTHFSDNTHTAVQPDFLVQGPSYTVSKESRSCFPDVKQHFLAETEERVAIEREQCSNSICGRMHDSAFHIEQDTDSHVYVGREKKETAQSKTFSDSLDETTASRLCYNCYQQSHFRQYCPYPDMYDFRKTQFSPAKEERFPSAKKNDSSVSALNEDQGKINKGVTPHTSTSHCSQTSANKSKLNVPKINSKNNSSQNLNSPLNSSVKKVSSVNNSDSKLNSQLDRKSNLESPEINKPVVTNQENSSSSLENKIAFSNSTTQILDNSLQENKELESSELFECQIPTGKISADNYVHVSITSSDYQELETIEEEVIEPENSMDKFMEQTSESSEFAVEMFAAMNYMFSKYTEWQPPDISTVEPETKREKSENLPHMCGKVENAPEFLCVASTELASQTVNSSPTPHDCIPMSTSDVDKHICDTNSDQNAIVTPQIETEIAYLESEKSASMYEKNMSLQIECNEHDHARSSEIAELQKRTSDKNELKLTLSSKKLEIVQFTDEQHSKLSDKTTVSLVESFHQVKDNEKFQIEASLFKSNKIQMASKFKDKYSVAKINSNRDNKYESKLLLHSTFSEVNSVSLISNENLSENKELTTTTEIVKAELKDPSPSEQIPNPTENDNCPKRDANIVKRTARLRTSIKSARNNRHDSSCELNTPISEVVDLNPKIQEAFFISFLCRLLLIVLCVFFVLASTVLKIPSYACNLREINHFCTNVGKGLYIPPSLRARNEYREMNTTKRRNTFSNYYPDYGADRTKFASKIRCKMKGIRNWYNHILTISPSLKVIPFEKQVNETSPILPQLAKTVLKIPTHVCYQKTNSCSKPDTKILITCPNESNPVVQMITSSFMSVPFDWRKRKKNIYI